MSGTPTILVRLNKDLYSNPPDLTDKITGEIFEAAKLQITLNERKHRTYTMKESDRWKMKRGSRWWWWWWFVIGIIEIGDNVWEGVAIAAEIDRLDRYLETCNDIIG